MVFTEQVISGLLSEAECSGHPGMLTLCKRAIRGELDARERCLDIALERAWDTAVERGWPSDDQHALKLQSDIEAERAAEQVANEEAERLSRSRYRVYLYGVSSSDVATLAEGRRACRDLDRTCTDGWVLLDNIRRVEHIPLRNGGWHVVPREQRSV